MTMTTVFSQDASFNFPGQQGTSQRASTTVDGPSQGMAIFTIKAGSAGLKANGMGVAVVGNAVVPNAANDMNFPTFGGVSGINLGPNEQIDSDPIPMTWLGTDHLLYVLDVTAGGTEGSISWGGYNAYSQDWWSAPNVESRMFKTVSGFTRVAGGPQNIGFLVMVKTYSAEPPPPPPAREDLMGNTLVLGETSERSFGIGTRDVVPNIPVVTTRPTTPNTALAADWMPNGIAVEFGNNGYTWGDWCDADCFHGQSPTGVTTARVGIRAECVEFGSRSFGRPLKPVWLTLYNGTMYVELDALNYDTSAPTLIMTFKYLPTYANNAAAIAGGLQVDQVYKDAADPGRLRIVY
jgi:hypothetical protein